MTRRIIKIISALLLIAIPTFIVVRNREVVPVYYTSQAPISISVGVLVLIVFVAGALASALVASIVGIFSWWEHKKLRKKELLRNAFMNTLVEARSASAAHEWNRAKSLWQRIIAKDPENTIARIELSRVYQQTGETKEALRTLEAMRGQHPDNAEVLFLISELLEREGSVTAALDNVLILLAKGFNARAATIGVELLSKLARWEDALRLWERLDQNGVANPETGAFIRYQLLSKRTFTKPEDEHAALIEFVKNDPAFAPACERLAKLQQQLGAPLDAAQALLKGAKASKHLDLYRQAIELLLEKAGDSRKAIAAARSAVAVVPRASQVEARLLLASVFIRLEEASDSEEALREVRDYCATESIMMSQREKIIQLCLQGMLLAVKGRYTDSRLLWREMLREAMRPGATDETYDYVNGTPNLPFFGQEAASSFYFG